MKVHIVATEAFRYTVEVRRLAVPIGNYSLAIMSTWLGAKDPIAEHTVVQLSLDAGGLIALRDLIDAKLQS